MPTFCRHNRFIERCPICSRTLPANEPATSAPRRARGTSSTRTAAGAGRKTRGQGLRVRHEGRAVEDGYRSELAPGLRASADASRLAQEIAFSRARLENLAIDPPGTYGLAHDAAAGAEYEPATWTCFLLAYLTPAEGDEPFAGIEAVLAAAPAPQELAPELGELLDQVAVGPRSSHVVGSGTRTLQGYAEWVQRAGGGAQAQFQAFTGDAGWDPQRRFARLFERFTLPGLSRAARYELLVTLGNLGLYELAADSLHLSTPRSGSGEDAAALAAKRVFGIGDPLLLDRRAAALAEAASVPLEALDLALFNWAAPQRATLGFSPSQQPDDGPIRALLGV
jgi:hypothetical protein